MEEPAWFAARKKKYVELFGPKPTQQQWEQFSFEERAAHMGRMHAVEWLADWQHVVAQVVEHTDLSRQEALSFLMWTEASKTWNWLQNIQKVGPEGAPKEPWQE